MSEWTIKSRAYKRNLSVEKLSEIVTALMPQPFGEIVLKREELNVINLNTDYYNTNVSEDTKRWFFLSAGQEHHRLLVYLSKLVSKQAIISIGSLKEGAPVALGSNTENEVYAFDPQNMDLDLASVPNIHVIEDELQNSPQYYPLILKSSLIFLDTDPHDGITETNFYNFLLQNGFKGLLVLDDIHYGNGMETFWSSITQRKFDASLYGHHSGTGLVFFNDTTTVKPM